MKKTAMKLGLWVLLAAATLVFAAGNIPAPRNPATGVWINRIGEIVDQPATNATLYYTKYIGTDRVKSIDYFYNGRGYLSLSNKKGQCNAQFADGIMHHPDGDLIVAGQGRQLYKIKKNTDPTGDCVVKTSPTKYKTKGTDPKTPNDRLGAGSTDGRGYWHVMVDPNQKYVWADGMPGALVRYSIENGQLADVGYQIELTPDDHDRRKDRKVTTVVWDTSGHAFFTYSEFTGGGCEIDINGNPCTAKIQDSLRSRSYFGYFTDTTWQKIVTDQDSVKYLGKKNDSVVIAMGTKILLDSLEGAHGATFDPYSNTIFLFGGAKIRQIKVKSTASGVVVDTAATIDLRDFFFPEDTTHMPPPRTPSCRQKADPVTGEWGNSGQSGYCDGGTNGRSGITPTVGWRLDQGTVDGFGHLFVASNTGHLIFVDYAANNDFDEE